MLVTGGTEGVGITAGGRMGEGGVTGDSGSGLG